MLNVKAVLALVEELEIEKKKTIYADRRYKRNGEWKKACCRERITTARYKELFNLIASDEAKVFKCAECGEFENWFFLENWCCDIAKDYFICACCYDEMSED
jgi:hypothetical protein